MKSWVPILLLATLALPAALTPGGDDHQERQIRGWTVQVHPDLATEDSELGRAVLEHLDHKLYDITHAVRPQVLEELRKVTIWMDVNDERVSGGVYHPSRKWLVEHDYDPRLARCIQFGNAQNFIGWSRDQPWMVIHELAHAYHHQVIGHDNAAVNDAFTKAKEGGAYEKVLRISGRTERAYGMNNAQEYFAELTEAYFGTNDFYPFVRAEVREFDPVGYAMLEEVWGK
jgi:hypothetical protein